ncbi:MAG: TRAP transporter large permease [Burkholderiaceae bacterium]
MDPITIGLIGLLILLVLILMHVPIGVALGLVGIGGCTAIIGWDAAVTLLRTEPSSAISAEGLAVIAMFLLMGNFAHTGGLSAELYRLAYSFFGHWRGGLVFATIGACAGFGAVSGSSVATAATMTRVALPEMRARGYSAALSSGAVASGGTLGMIIPPSVVMILYGTLTENSVIALFLAAVIPGLLAVAFYFVAIAVYTRLYPETAPLGERVGWPARVKTFLDCWAILLLAVAVSGGIYSGIFSVTEAASVGASIALILAVVRRRMSLRNFLECLRDTAQSTGLIFVLIIGASVFSYFATLSGLPEKIVESIEATGLPPLTIILLLQVMYLILGAIFDTIAAMVLTLPFVYPLITGMGYDPIWWGVINIVVIELGMITPPIGINVFVLHGMAPEYPLSTIFRGVIPFVFADLARLILLILVPSLSLWLPRAAGWL